MPLSQSPISSPFAPELGGPGGELSGATTPCHQWTRPQQPPGMSPGSSWPESASPLCRPHQVFGGGGPQSHSGKGFRGRSSLGPHEAGSPPSSPPDRLEKHSLIQCRLLSLPLPAFPPPQSLSLAQPMLLWPLVFLTDWRSQGALQGCENGRFL